MAMMQREQEQKPLTQQWVTTDCCLVFAIFDLWHLPCSDASTIDSYGRVPTCMVDMIHSSCCCCSGICTLL